MGRVKGEPAIEKEEGVAGAAPATPDRQRRASRIGQGLGISDIARASAHPDTPTQRDDDASGHRPTVNPAPSESRLRRAADGYLFAASSRAAASSIIMSRLNRLNVSKAGLSSDGVLGHATVDAAARRLANFRRLYLLFFASPSRHKEARSYLVLLDRNASDSPLCCTIKQDTCALLQSLRSSHGVSESQMHAAQSPHKLF
ncbi:uncharacterized protein BDR25DRAFT_376780 [Lindgomyces ingoldianus]|uniref:Uncharacterized protein n=1 Tax=Lindgomyces ingoldianus TaxID=673940 RepID=A0ACB6QLV1_9PLEO|nr:uncharacterized protein BDR25DRAFT_376780 [Lindgomyces ingoldianus]KAF2467121.1 hypothetical protein BDR25DRAFT_376780 [Lindgomyces ingoldianus]